MTIDTLEAVFDCAALFRDEALPDLPLPESLISSMRSKGGYRFAGPGWIADTNTHEAALRWLRAGATVQSASCALIPMGAHATLAQVGFVSPSFAFFVSKLASQGVDDGVFQRRRMEGSFKLMKRLIDAAANAAAAWPSGKRLIVVDDDAQDLRWGWVPSKYAQWSDLAPDAMAWVSALVALPSAS